MAKSISIDLVDATTQVRIERSGGSIAITGEYLLAGGGFQESRGRTFSPSDFTAAQRATLQDAFNIVLAKCRTAEGV